MAKKASSKSISDVIAESTPAPEASEPAADTTQAETIVESALSEAPATVDPSGDPPAPAAPAAPAPAAPRKRGRPAGSGTKRRAVQEPEPEPAPVDMAEFIPNVARGLAVAFSTLGRTAADLRDVEEWNIGEERAGMLGEAWAPILAPLLARYPTSAVWVSALGVSYAILAPGVRAELSRAKLARAANREAAAAG